MNPVAARVVLTGATGGIGAVTATRLAAAGAALLLVGHDRARVEALASMLPGSPLTLAADLTSAADRARLAATAQVWNANALVNNAGIGAFARLEQQDPAAIERLLALNLLAPIALCRELLPALRRQPEAAIINVGSVFGTIGHPGYTTYCASKAGLRVFTQALRRELAGTAIAVHHVAPRATRTAMNATAVDHLNATLGNAVDPPERVAGVLLAALCARRGRDWTIGWPERLLVRLNAMLPSVLDRGLATRLPTIEEALQ